MSSLQQTRRQLLRAAMLGVLAIGLAGCGANQVPVSSNTDAVQAALKQGKGVLVARKTTLDFYTASHEMLTLPGDARPALTYWLHRDSKKPLVLGAWTSSEGHGKRFVGNADYYILEPGFYDLVGFARKTRNNDTVRNLQRARTSLQSTLGFVQFSRTTLPHMEQYKEWIPPSYAGATVNGNMITHWYDPGYYADATREVQGDAIFIDFRGVIPYDKSGKGNLASFYIKPGQLLTIGDFDVAYTNGPAETPRPEVWVSPLESITYYFNPQPQHAELQQVMTQMGYPANLVQQVGTAVPIPGMFFQNMKPIGANPPGMGMLTDKLYYLSVTAKSRVLTPH
ncbi:hypothetical protein [Leeia aquatica]|uniref:Uncharacterized protein n=1 Tax=Leeia aquatica TaxID=2725557 RepID=A0A847S1J0_9NEIS|nr:hypothetical protein [Leeia aquatica]NLR75721.1 hypothetical protein [Leeia aquatica]